MSEQVCFVVHSMSPHIQQAYWRSVGEPFEVTPRHLVWREHRMSEFGNCQRCGWRPKGEDRVRSHSEQLEQVIHDVLEFVKYAPEIDTSGWFETELTTPVNQTILW